MAVVQNSWILGHSHHIWRYVPVEVTLSSILVRFLGVLALGFLVLGAKGQDLEVLQPPGALSVSAGETLTLTCTVRGTGPPGGVKWHKGSDRKQPIYSERGQYPSRVTRVVAGSQTDFSIRISNIRPEDAGTFYCVKYRAGSQETEFKSGVGTEVSVIATPSQPSIEGPASRVLSGTSATFNCTSDGFSPRAIKVTWLKDNTRIVSPEPTVLPEGDSISYQVLSSAQVPLTRDDVKSQLICQIEHETLQSPLREFFKLGDILRVPPRVKLEANPANPVPLNESVTFSCSAEGFYPEDTTLALTLNSSLSETGTAEPMAQNGDGTFTLRSSLKLNATEERNQSAFTCLVMQNSQPVATETSVLNIRVLTEGSESVSMEPGRCSPVLRPSIRVDLNFSFLSVSLCLGLLAFRPLHTLTGSSYSSQEKQPLCMQ
uniref:Ig-like domain-containing protein n=1 Tax=Podarcis muralis TaxID=64176 RepID=A0A670I471_PODMU